MELFVVKTIHIIGVISWFAGLFYLGRIFVYHSEAFEKSAQEKYILTSQFKLMEQRVFKIIMNPALLITWITGLVMIHLYGLEWFKLSVWLHYKMTFLIFLSIYHAYCAKVIKKLGKEEFLMSSMGFRLFNEVPTILMILIVSLAVYKNTLSIGVLLFWIFVITVLLIILTRIYKSIRDRS
jgi:putative membrane protein